MKTVHAYAAKSAGKSVEPFEYTLPDIGPEEIDIKVEYCGLCHSDLSMMANEWGMTAYPFIGGHEIIGTIEAMGGQVKGFTQGQRIGLGWMSHSCLHCQQCFSGDHNLCGKAEQTIVGRHGGFADTVRCHWEWAIPLPGELDAQTAGPLFCGGITVFNPIIQLNIKPTQRVGVIGIGGLGHMALQFLNKWGCEVTAFTSSSGKKDEAIKMGAHYVVNSKDGNELKKQAGSLDFILNTANADLDWDALFAVLAPKGHLHTVGVIPKPISVAAMTLIGQQRSLSGSPLGSPSTIRTMLEFCARHKIAPITETLAMQDLNKALVHLDEGKARYRLILKI